MIDANASGIENAIMAFAIGAVLLLPALGGLWLVISFLRRGRRQQTPGSSFFDVIGRR
jgi:hypothetical protein